METLLTKVLMVSSVIGGGGLGIFLIHKISEEKTIREVLEKEGKKILDTKAEYKTEEDVPTEEFWEWIKMYGWIYSVGEQEIKKNMFAFIDASLEDTKRDISWERDHENIEKLKKTCNNNLSEEGNYYLDDNFRKKIGKVRDFCTKHEDEWFKKKSENQQTWQKTRNEEAFKQSSSK